MINNNKKVRNLIICPHCKRKIDLNEQQEQESIEKVGNQEIYYCYCGEEILL